jgi:hypothetical protein
LLAFEVRDRCSTGSTSSSCDEVTGTLPSKEHIVLANGTSTQSGSPAQPERTVPSSHFIRQPSQLGGDGDDDATDERPSRRSASDVWAMARTPPQTADERLPQSQERAEICACVSVSGPTTAGMPRDASSWVLWGGPAVERI